MSKFIIGLVAGLSIGFFAIKYQTRKVDYYSYNAGYMHGRMDQFAAGFGQDETIGQYGVLKSVICDAYNTNQMDTYPFGYTVDEPDKELKELCQRP